MSLLSKIRGGCLLRGQHWLWRGALANGATPVMWHEGSVTSVRRLTLEARDGGAPDRTLQAITRCEHANCVSPKCVQLVTLGEARAAAAARGAYKKNPLRHVRATITRRARSHVSDEAVQRMRDSQEPAAVVAAAEGVHRSYVSYVRAYAIRRDIAASPWAGLGARS